MGSRRYGLCGALAVAMAGALAGCAAPPPPPPPPTVVQVKLSAAAGVNPNQAGAPSPIVVRVYQLASPAAFEKAEFFRLLNADAVTLGTDLVKKDEYLMAPGTSKEDQATVPDRVKALGVMAVYRDWQSKTWRLVVPVPPNKTTPVTVAVGAGGLQAAP